MFLRCHAERSEASVTDSPLTLSNRRSRWNVCEKNDRESLKHLGANIIRHAFRRHSDTSRKKGIVFRRQMPFSRDKTAFWLAKRKKQPFFRWRTGLRQIRNKNRPVTGIVWRHIELSVYIQHLVPTNKFRERYTCLHQLSFRPNEVSGEIFLKMSLLRSTWQVYTHILKPFYKHTFNEMFTEDLEKY